MIVAIRIFVFEIKMDNKKDIITKLRRCSEGMAKTIPITKVILFGSYVHGHITKDSDIDLLVIGRKKNRRLRTELGLRFHKSLPRKPIDVLLKTEDEMKKRIKIGDNFIKKIVDEGEIIYERDYKRMAG